MTDTKSPWHLTQDAIILERELSGALKILRGHVMRWRTRSFDDPGGTQDSIASYLSELSCDLRELAEKADAITDDAMEARFRWAG